MSFVAVREKMETEKNQWLFNEQIPREDEKERDRTYRVKRIKRHIIQMQNMYPIGF